MTVCSCQLTNNMCFIANSRTYGIFKAFGFLAIFSAAMPRSVKDRNFIKQTNNNKAIQLR